MDPNHGECTKAVGQKGLTSRTHNTQQTNAIHSLPPFAGLDGAYKSNSSQLWGRHLQRLARNHRRTPVQRLAKTVTQYFALHALEIEIDHGNPQNEMKQALLKEAVDEKAERRSI